MSQQNRNTFVDNTNESSSIIRNTNGSATIICLTNGSASIFREQIGVLPYFVNKLEYFHIS
jgi:hypothetical protein